MKPVSLFHLLMAIALSSCGSLFPPKKIDAAKTKPKPFGETGIPPMLRKNAPQATSTLSNGAPSGVPEFVASEDLVYTNPDNPDANIPELSTLLSDNQRAPWEDSEKIAKNLSMREGKPLLIWFTDSQRSALCKAASEELFATHEFGSWAKARLIRLKVDANVQVKDESLDLSAKEDLRSRIMSYNKAIIARYKVRGNPTFIMLSPSGEVTGRFSGYKRGEAQFLWGQFKHAETLASQSYQAWRTSLEKKGYREWQDRKGRTVLARLLSYSEGKLTLIEPDGTRSQAQETRLCDADQAWITAQKALRKQ